jgi:hypothetical protein
MGNACLLKLAEEYPKNLLYLTAPLRDSIREEAKCWNTQRVQAYNYGIRIGMLVI